MQRIYHHIGRQIGLQASKLSKFIKNKGNQEKKVKEKAAKNMEWREQENCLRESGLGPSRTSL